MGRSRRNRFHMLGQVLGVGVAEVDGDLRVVAWDKQLAKWTHNEPEEAVGRLLGELFPNIGQRDETVARIGRALERGRSLRLEPPSGEPFLPIPTVDERHYAFMQQHLFVRPFKEEGERRALVVVHDVTKVALWMRAMEFGVAHFREEAEGARRVARLDDLTGLLNRGPALAAIAQAAEDEEEMAVLLIDLDHFKKVNDTWGHPAGDDVLRETARRLRDKVRRTDIVGRVGGEEFLVVLPGAPAHIGRRVGRAILGALRDTSIRVPILPSGTANIRITASLGLARWHTGDDFDEVLARADEALYRAKESGRDRLELAAK